MAYMTQLTLEKHVSMLILWRLHDPVKIMIVGPDLPGLQHIK